MAVILWKNKHFRHPIPCVSSLLVLFFIRILEIRTVELSGPVIWRPQGKNSLHVLHLPNAAFLIRGRPPSDGQKFAEWSWEGSEILSQMSAEFFQGSQLLGTLS